jgi:hypothetical protein
MLPILLALSSRGVTAGMPDPHAALVCFAIALGGTTAVGWWASRLESQRVRRERDALLAAPAAAGIH